MLFEDELAHVNTVNVDNDLDAVAVEDVAGDEEPNAKLLARFGLDVDDLAFGVSVFLVSMFFDGVAIHEYGRLELGEEGVRCHDKSFVAVVKGSRRKKSCLNHALSPNKWCCWGKEQ